MNENEIINATTTPCPTEPPQEAVVEPPPAVVPATSPSPTASYGFEPLTEAEVRVVACLVEKKITTPEYFPLTVNSLVAACNQKSNRHPVVEFDEKTVLAALETLRRKRLACLVSPMGARSAKYDHRLAEQLHISKPSEMAIFCELMLRGPQTVGELRTHGERMCPFASMDGVQATIDDLCARAATLVVKLPRAPGHKECRYAHLLAGMPELSATGDDETAHSISSFEIISTTDRERIASLETEVAALKTQLADLRSAFDRFKAQF